MQLPFERWLADQVIDDDSASCFDESFVCFKAAAYKAALLFAFLGFTGVIRSRILKGLCPNGISEGDWRGIQARVRTAETWDKAVIDCIHKQTPAPIFLVSPDVRQQVSYWKDRRNDCAHSKHNLIIHAHVEGFLAFVQGNLDKFAVNGSRPEMLAKIIDFFNPSITSPNQSMSGIVSSISHAVPASELEDFLQEVAAGFDSSRSYTAQLLKQEEPNKLIFFSGCFKFGAPELQRATVAFFNKHRTTLLAYLRRFPEDIYKFNEQHPFLRQLWHDHLFTDKNDDFRLLASMLRHELIPEAQIAEAMRRIVSRPIKFVPTPLDEQILERYGFYDELERSITNEDTLLDFKWANTNSALILKFLKDRSISHTVAGALHRAFDHTHYAFELAADLNGFFASSPEKRQEYRNHNLPVPRHIQSIEDPIA